MHDYRFVLPFVGLVTLAGCASASHQKEKEELDAMRVQLGEVRSLIVAQGGKIESIESRMGMLNEKVNLSQSHIDNIMANRKAIAAPVARHASTGAGTEPETVPASNDPEAGFAADTAIQDYRKGQILFEARKYREAVLAFADFVEKYPDHPLAGSAQYGVGEAYFQQKEYKLCLPEFERVLTSYDRSPHVSETLRDMAEAEEILKMTEQAARHRQLLTSLFPQSPAASSLSSVPASREPDSVQPASAAGHAPGQIDEAPRSEPSSNVIEPSRSTASVEIHAQLPTAPMDTGAPEIQGVP